MSLMGNGQVKRLFQAIRDDDRATVQRLLKKGVSLNSTNEKEQTSLIYACEEGHLDIARLLLNYKMSVKDTSGATSLMKMRTRYKSDLERATQFMEDKVMKVNVQDDSGWAAIRSRSYKGHLDIANLLLDKNVQVDYRDVLGWTALIHASNKGHLEITRLLIDMGAKLDIVTTDGMSALMIASKNGCIEVARLLLDRGAQVDIQTNKRLTAYTIANRCGHADIAKMLLERGANKAFLVEGRACALKPRSTLHSIESNIENEMYRRLIQDRGKINCDINCENIHRTNDETYSESDLQCPICLEAFRVNDCVAWSLRLKTCTHVFHTDCIQEWLGKSQFDCPCCRGDFRGVNTRATQKVGIHGAYGNLTYTSTSEKNVYSSFCKRKEGQFCIRRGLMIPC